MVFSQIQISELIGFFRQFGLAVAGAAALWGFVFAVKARRASGGEKAGVFSLVAKSFLVPLNIGIFAALLGWVLISFFQPAALLAHEGVAIEPSQNQVAAALRITSPVYIALGILFLLGLFFYKIYRSGFLKKLPVFYAFIFAAVIFLIGLPVWTGRLGAEQWFFIGHGVHSIFTLGTVVMVDLLVFLARHRELVARYVYGFLPVISKVIWVGLGLDFLSVYLILDRTLDFSAKFYFMQTIVTLIILNGVLLSGPITQKLISLVKKDGVEKMSKKWTRFAGVSGILSVASWTTITFTDFLEHITVPYLSFFWLWAAAIAVFCAAEFLFDKLVKNRLWLLEKI